MGRISADDARVAATKIVEPIQKKMNELEEQIRVKVTEYVTSAVPAEIMKVFKSANCDYIAVSNEVNLIGYGFNKRSVRLIGNLPLLRNDGNYSYPKFELNKTQADVIQKLCDKKEKLKDKYNTTKKEVEASIIVLATHKRVSEEFPEAWGFLPGVKTDTGLMVQLAPVRAKVACLISEDVEKKCIDKL